MPSIKAGRLRHRITIQEQQQTQDPVTGGIIVTWVDVATVWGRLEPLSVREFIQSQATQSEITARITIRYRPGLNASMRFVHRGSVYNPAGILPDAESGIEHITIPCSQGVNDGE